MLNATQHVLAEVGIERDLQERKFPEQRLPNGSCSSYRPQADAYRRLCDNNDAADCLSWADILREEFYEALAEEDDEELRAELVQVAAVAVRWIEAIDQRV